VLIHLLCLHYLGQVKLRDSCNPLRISVLLVCSIFREEMRAVWLVYGGPRLCTCEVQQAHLFVFCPYLQPKEIMLTYVPP